MITRKLRRFQENQQLENVLEHTDYRESGLITSLRGEWGRIFGNDHPLTLELACGRGDYTLAMARMYPGRNFAGVDIKGARIWKGATAARDQSLENVRFIRMSVHDLTLFFGNGEVEEIWITFPDPFPKPRFSGRRLTSPRFLEAYRQVLRAGGSVHLKTDSELLWRYTREVVTDVGAVILREVADVWKEAADDPHLSIQTTYEKRHLAEGRTIRYLQFRP